MLFIKGANFGFMARRGYYRSAAGRAEIDAIAGTGAPWVALIVTMAQETNAAYRYGLTPAKASNRKTMDKKANAPNGKAASGKRAAINTGRIFRDPGRRVSRG